MGAATDETHPRSNHYLAQNHNQRGNGHVNDDVTDFDYRGQPMKLQTKRTYRLRVKNGYILALLPQQHQVKLPNLLNVQKAS